MNSCDDDLEKFEVHGAAPLPCTDDQGYVNHDGARIWYANYGSGSPVILLHGGLVRADGIDYLIYCLEKPASYQGACVYDVTGSPKTALAASQATAPAAKSATSAASPANTGPPSCQPVPGFYSPNITQDERDKFAGLRGAFPTPAVQWQLGQWGAGVPQRNGYDQNVRTVWMCNLFFCR